MKVLSCFRDFYDIAELELDRFLAIEGKADFLDAAGFGIESDSDFFIIGNDDGANGKGRRADRREDEC